MEFVHWVVRVFYSRASQRNFPMGGVGGVPHINKSELVTSTVVVYLLRGLKSDKSARNFSTTSLLLLKKHRRVMHRISAFTSSIVV